MPGDVDEYSAVAGRSLSVTLLPRRDVEKLIRVQVTLKDGTVYGDYRYYSVLRVLYLEVIRPMKRSKKRRRVRCR